jgi:hypothetical protein
MKKGQAGSVITLKPGETLVLKSKESLTSSVIDRLVLQAKKGRRGWPLVFDGMEFDAFIVPPESKVVIEVLP